MPILLLTHLICGATPCVVSILALYLTEQQSLSNVLTPTTEDYVSDTSLYSFR